VLHGTVSEVAGQDFPPLHGAERILRVRVEVPPPHVFEQVENGDQSPILQSTGDEHGFVLHD